MHRKLPKSETNIYRYKQTFGRTRESNTRLSSQNRPDPDTDIHTYIYFRIYKKYR